MSSYPFWVTAATLPSRAEGYSYSSNPEILLYGETTNQPCTASIPPINGTLPPGTQVEFVAGQIRIVGQIQGSIDGTTYEFTLRLSNGTFSTDRTFRITVANVQDRLEWLTPNNKPLGYYFVSEPVTFAVVAQNTPLKSITYSLTSPITWTQGLSIESNTGLTTLNLRWRPTTPYTTVDYVLNNNFLYKCIVAGTSGLSNGPVVPGSAIVDSSDPAWQPNSYYVVNTVVTNDNGKIYVCLASGFSSAGTGPTGTGGNIPDGFPTAWSYIGQAAVWSQVTPGTTDLVTFSVQAATNTQQIVQSYDIELLSRPYEPIWLTPAGILATLVPGANFTFALEVFDPDFQGIAFTSSNLPNWLNLSTLGELWGRAPAVLSSTDYDFTVIASDGVFSVPRNFLVSVEQEPEQIQWLSPNYLGHIEDGAFSSIQFRATTSRPGASVLYGLRGGIIPLNTTVESSTGMLSGFVDYHAVSKTYLFEISASDGTDIETRWFQLTVKSQNREKFLNISIPITGAEKLQFITNNSPSLIAPEFLFREQDTNWSRNDSPEIAVVSGLNYTNIAEVRNSLSNWLSEFELSYGALNTSELESLEYQTLFVTIRDSNSLGSWTPFTQYKQNERVSTSSGQQFLALVAGVSGDYPEPTVSGADGSVVWQLVSVPNSSTLRTPPLPWYPAHLYQQTQTVVNFGNVYEATLTGRSSGGFGPQGTNFPIADGTTSWTQTISNGPNVAYPPSIYNIRRESIRLLGFASSKGSGAVGFANVNAITGGITSVSIINKGSGYYSQPEVSITGEGSGAVVSVDLELQSTNIISSSAGFSMGQTFTVSQGLSLSQDFAQIEISGVDSVGFATQLTITHSGTYQQFPKGNITFVLADRALVVFFDLGVKSVLVVSPGTGYSTGTSVNFSGNELLPSWQSQWAKNHVLSIPLAYITLAGAEKFKTTPFLVNPYQGQTIEVKQLKFSLQGLIWTGNTTFDESCMSWDVAQTQLVEFDPATETLFDGGFEIFDRDSTQFDRGAMNIAPFSATVFDENTTIYDYYATLFDARPGAASSRFSRSWIVNFGRPWQ